MPYGGFDCPMYISWGPRPYEFPPVNVATDTCGDLAPTIPPFLDCSLCGLGWPQASGIIDFRLYRDPACPGNESGILNDYSYWHNGAYLPGSFQLQCANPGDNAEPNANQWVVNKNYYWGSLYKMYCTVTVASLTSVTVTGTIYWLSNIDNQWKTWVTFSQTVNEYNPSGNTDPRRPRSFISTKIPISPTGQYGGKGDITDIKFALATYPQIEGCGKELCSMFNGQYYSTCFRAEITDPGVPPQIRQIGKNTIPCGTQDPYGSWYTDCECDQITLKSSGPHENGCQWKTWIRRGLWFHWRVRSDSQSVCQSSIQCCPTNPGNWKSRCQKDRQWSDVHCNPIARYRSLVDSYSDSCPGDQSDYSSSHFRFTCLESDKALLSIVSKQSDRPRCLFQHDPANTRTTI